VWGVRYLPEIFRNLTIDELIRREALKAATHAGIVLILIVGINVGLGFAMNTIFHFNNGLDSRRLTFIEMYLNKQSPIQKFSESPSAVANAIAPPSVRVVENALGRANKDGYEFMFTLQGIPGLFSGEDALGLIVILLMIAGCVRYLIANRTFQILAICSLLVLAFNLIFHAIWGVEYFLYSQHWYFSSLICLSGSMLVKGRFRYFSDSLFAAMVICVAVNNCVRFYEMIVLLGSCDVLVR